MLAFGYAAASVFCSFTFTNLSDALLPLSCRSLLASFQCNHHLFLTRGCPLLVLPGLLEGQHLYVLCPQQGQEMWHSLRSKITACYGPIHVDLQNLN